MTVCGKTKTFSNKDEAHAWFQGMVKHQRAARLVDKANQRTLKWNAEND